MDMIISMYTYWQGRSYNYFQANIMFVDWHPFLIWMCRSLISGSLMSSWLDCPVQSQNSCRWDIERGDLDPNCVIRLCVSLFNSCYEVHCQQKGTQYTTRWRAYHILKFDLCSNTTKWCMFILIFNKLSIIFHTRHKFDINNCIWILYIYFSILVKRLHFLRLLMFSHCVMKKLAVYFWSKWLHL